MGRRRRMGADQAPLRAATAIDQALPWRGEGDSVGEAAYLRFVRAVVDEEENASAAARLAEERAYLRSLRSTPVASTRRSNAGGGSGARSGSAAGLLGAVAVDRSQGRGSRSSGRRWRSSTAGGCCARYRVRGARRSTGSTTATSSGVWSGSRAFARHRCREELFPSLVFRAAYDALGWTHGEQADVWYVRLLHLAARDQRATGGGDVSRPSRPRGSCDDGGVQAEVRPPVTTMPVVRIPCSGLAQYDALVTGGSVG